jgi:hypothetical protein
LTNTSAAPDPASGYLLMDGALQTGSPTVASVAVSSTDVNSPTTLAAWITPPSTPSIAFTPDGQWHVRLGLERTGGTEDIYVRVWVGTYASGAESPITNSAWIPVNTSAVTSFRVNMGLHAMTTATRLYFALQAYGETAGLGCDITYGGAPATDDDRARLDVPMTAADFALLAGRPGGQTLTGGTASGDALHLASTTNATKGAVVIDDSELQVGPPGCATPGVVEIGNGTANVRLTVPAVMGASYILTVPTNYPVADGYLITVDDDGVMHFVDPTTISVGGYWDRTGSVLSPTTAEDCVSVTNTTGYTALTGISNAVGISGRSTAGGYGLRGRSSTGRGLYAYADGAAGVGIRGESTYANGIEGFTGSADNGVYSLAAVPEGGDARTLLGQWADIAEDAAPATPETGYARVYAKTDGKVYSKDDAGTEYDLTAGMANPMTDKGDMIYADTSGVPLRLALGSDDTVLTIDNTTHLPKWIAAVGFANPMTTAGDLILGGASGAPGRLGIGTDNYVLTMDSGTHLPKWLASTGSGYATVQEEGAGVTQRAILNFIGSAFTAADDAGNTRTNVSATAILNALASLANAAGSLTNDGSGNLSYVPDAVTLTNTVTLTNKRITARVQSVSDAATITPDADANDAVDITAIAQAFTIANPSGTPTNFQKLQIRIKDNGAARAITFGTAYAAGGVSLPTTTVLSKILNLGFIYNTANSLNKWQLVAMAQEA